MQRQNKSIQECNDSIKKAKKKKRKKGKFWICSARQTLIKWGKNSSSKSEGLLFFLIGLFSQYGYYKDKMERHTFYLDLIW